MSLTTSDPYNIRETNPSIIDYSHACGWFLSKGLLNTYKWTSNPSKKYNGGGDGTFSIDPVYGIQGFYIGNKSLKDILSQILKQYDDSIDQINVKLNNLDKSVTKEIGELREIIQSNYNSIREILSNIELRVNNLEILAEQTWEKSTVTTNDAVADVVETEDVNLENGSQTQNI